MSPISIAHIDSEIDFRGGQEALLVLARGLAARGHHQLLFTPGGSGLEKRAHAAGLITAPLPSGPLSWLRLTRGVDVIHTHSGRAQTPIWLLGPLMKPTRVATRHVAFEPRNRMIHGWKYGAGCDAVIAVSGAVRRILLGAGVPDRKIELIATGVQIPASPPSAEERGAARAAFGLAPSDFVIGQMGAFTREKGHDIAIEAAAILRESLPAARLVLAGAGPLAEALRAQSERTPARVDFLGHVADRGQFFAALDVLIMPSRAEAWGLAALEAMAHGVPVIASNVGGLAEIVSVEDGSRLVAPGDSAALAQAIGEAAADPERLRRAGLQGRERARRFSVRETIERTEALYLRLLGR